MAQQFIAVAAFVCFLAAFVQSAPQSQFGAQRQNNQFQPQQFQQRPQQFQAPVHVQEPERQSRFLVAEDQFHQDPNGEYNFQ